MPVPPSVPLPKVAQTLRFLVRPISFLERWRRELGETFAASLYGPGDVVFVSGAEDLKALFGRDRQNTIAPGRNIVLRPLLGEGSLLRQEGDEHLRRRKLMLPPFHGERMRAYEELVTEATESAASKWREGEPFALHPTMQAITLEVILRAVFGVDVSQAKRHDELSKGLTEILGATGSPRAVGLLFPVVRKAPPYRRLTRLIDRVDELLAAQIAERRSDPDLAERDDILSMLVQARFDDGTEMSDAEVRDQLMTLLLAGHETTATALAWAFDLLFRHPDAFERLSEEVRSGDGHEYLDAVISETLRVRPVVPFTGRELRERTVLDGFELEPGQVVLAAIWLTHTRPDLYPEPFAFRPERFLDGAVETYSWVPFGGGTRRCIGAAFAQMEMRVALGAIVRSCDVRPATDAAERPIRRNVTMSPAQGTPAVLARRVDGPAPVGASALRTSAAV
ncbi:MAG: cytochrome P450 [Actinomycetota bacterium]|nr:cytochrome P450 [Actinomycetota bacterium]